MTPLLKDTGRGNGLQVCQTPGVCAQVCQVTCNLDVHNRSQLWKIHLEIYCKYWMDNANFQKLQML